MTGPRVLPPDGVPRMAAAKRPPQAFAPDDVTETAPPPADDLAAARERRGSWLGRLLWTSAGALVSAGFGLAAERLIRDLFAAHPYLGWAGIGVLGLLVAALLGLAVREIAALMRLRALEKLRGQAQTALETDRLADAKPVIAGLNRLYRARPDLARPLAALEHGAATLFDGSALVVFAEQTLMAPLDAEARGLTAAAARRVALVTAISPRAGIDIAFVVWESLRLAGAIARLYGGRPGFWGALRLAGAILGHLAVTGGLVLTEGVVEQLFGQGLAAKLSQRFGEGVVNALMTARVGIAAMRVVRPLPFAAAPSPVVADFVPGLLKK